MANPVPGEATILESVFDPERPTRESVDQERDQGIVGILVDNTIGIPYEFLLELHVPGVPEATVRIRSRVPDKAERLTFLNHVRIPATLVVPVMADPEAPEKTTIDWKAFLRLPDRVQRMKDAARRTQVQALGIPDDRAAAPISEQDEVTRLMVFRMAKAVRAGTGSRDQFEQNCQLLMQVNQLARADYEAAVALIDAP